MRKLTADFARIKSERTLRKRLELIMTDTQTPEDQAADLDNVERDANH